MRVDYRRLAERAMYASIDARTSGGADVQSPICIYDFCEKKGITVRFVDISMEGVYDRLPKPRIHLSALRPFGRRAFNCAHELGHHVFGHGSRIDELREELTAYATTDPDEFLVNAFAGFMLMPSLGLREAFAARNLDPNEAKPADILAVACSFGVGYETLIGHMAYGIRELSVQRAKELMRSNPKSIRTELLGNLESSRLWIADRHWSASTIDLETGGHLLVPSGASLPSLVTHVAETQAGSVYRADTVGIVRVCPPDAPWSAFIRVMPHQYVGLARFRHLAEPEDD